MLKFNCSSKNEKMFCAMTSIQKFYLQGKKMIKKLSLITCGLVLSSSMAFGADSLESAIKGGKASGALTAYTGKYNNETGLDSGFTNGNIAVAYETDSYMGLSAKAEFKGNHKFSEVEDGDYKGSFENKALMTEAYVKYTNDMFGLSAGRQAVDLEWMGDYHEAVVASVTAIPSTTIVAGYTDKMAVSDEDESSDFKTIGELAGLAKNKGAYVLDVKYEGLSGIVLNPYAYSAPDLADWYGLKGTYTTDMFGVVAHYAGSSEDTVGMEDGSIGHLELSATLAGVTAKAGYITTDKDVGVGSMASLGDNISPFDTGLSTYDADADTVYGSLGYNIVGIDLGALYGQTTYGSSNYKEKELNLTAGYSFTDSLSASVLYGDVNADEKEGNTEKVDNNYGLLTVAFVF